MWTRSRPRRGGAEERPTRIRKSARGRGGSHIPGQSGLSLKRFVYLFIITTAVLGLCSCAQAFSGYGRWGPLVAVLGLRNAVASLTVEHGPWSTGSVVVLLGLSCPRAQPMSASQTMDLTPALASRFLTTQTTREAPSGLLINGGSHGTAFGRKIKVDTPGQGKRAGGRRNR